jgi:multicomponent Na+:H+ antiporter subunit E
LPEAAVENKDATHNPAESPRFGKAPAPAPVRHWGQTVALFLILSGFWMLLSGRMGIQYAIFLVTSVGIVLWLNPERPLPGLDPSRGAGISGLLRAGQYLLRFIVWLVWNVLKANLQVAAIILHPRLPVDPQFLVYRTTLKSDLAKVLVANSTTLTPGTITVDLKKDRFLVHALTPATASALTTAELQNVVGAIFGEDPDPVPEILWSASYVELGS